MEAGTCLPMLAFVVMGRTAGHFIILMSGEAPQSEHDHLVEISWDEFFREFDERKLALIYDRDGMFSKLVGRNSVKERVHS